MDNAKVEITWMVGTKYIEPVRYRVERETVKRRFRRTKEQFYIASDFVRLGPFDDPAEVASTLAQLKSYG